jgi:hypothetical protein
MKISAAMSGVEADLGHELDHLAAGDLGDGGAERFSHRVLEELPILLDRSLLAGVDQRPFDRGVDVAPRP